MLSINHSAFEEDSGLRPLTASCLHGDLKATTALVSYFNNLPLEINELYSYI